MHRFVKEKKLSQIYQMKVKSPMKMEKSDY